MTYKSALDINKEFRQENLEKKLQEKKALKSKKKTKKQKEKNKTYYIKKADTIWSEIIKIRAGYKCEYC